MRESLFLSVFPELFSKMGLLGLFFAAYSTSNKSVFLFLFHRINLTFSETKNRKIHKIEEKQTINLQNRK